jgi:beta-1,4-N-acetylglucosaminyltransferase
MHPRHVAEALDRARDLVAKGWHTDLPAYTPPPFPVPEDQRTKLFDWLVWSDSPKYFI